MSGFDPREGDGLDSVRATLEALGPGFELLRELGRGATAIVYLVRDHELDRDLAVKVIRSSFGADEEAMARLDREAKLVARLQHPNIVKLYGTQHLPDGSMVLLMEHVPGRNLKELLQDTGPLPPRRAMALLEDVASALAYAHRRKIVHRDVKPENIYIDDEVGTARLADFGVARPWDLDTRLTLPGESLGTPAYMAPEQIDGGDVDGRSDVFSLGLVAYEMLAGEHPWEGDSIYSIIFKQKHEDPPDLRTIRPDISDRVVAIVERAVHKAPDERWASADEMLDALKALEAPEVDPLLHGLEGEASGVATASGTAVTRKASSRGREAVPSRTPAAPPAATGRRRGGARVWILAGAAAVLLASAWQPLGLGRLIAGAIGDTVDDPATPPVTETVAEAPPPVPAEPGEPRLLAGRGGNAQTGPVGRLLPEPLRLQVLDSAGVPVPGVVVAFEVVAGQASGMADTTITDADGVVYTPITLPSTPQDVEIVARLAERPEIMTSFMLSAVPATGAEIGGIDGDDQSAPPGRSLPDALLLRVLDEDGAPVEGAEVEFTTESGGIQPQFDLTDADGWAVGRWTLGDELGVQEAIARVTGGAGSVVFRATAVDPAEVEADSTDAASDPDAPSASAPRVARRGWDVGGAMVCVIGAGGRPFCRGGTSASDDVSGIVAVAAGVTHACGLDEDGFAWCWGSNTAGQLGDGSRTSHAGRPVEGTRFARLAAGVEHTCGLDADGRAHCWGRSLSGQLGTGGRDDRTVPVPVASPLRFVGLASGWQHTCGLTGSGQIHCWGLNSEGQLGDGTRVDRLAPVSVAAGGGFQEIAAGSAHTCGLRDGQVYCWGNNQHGQLGSGTSLPATRPGVVPGLPPVVSVVAGASHTCARTAAGEVFCWGQNVHGQLGDGSNEARSAPTPVAGDIRFTSILGGGGITCGRSDQGELWCWGFNQNGQLGDGTRNNRSLPTRVGG